MTKAKAPAEPETMVVDGTTYEVRKARWKDLGIGSIVLATGGRRWTVVGAAMPLQFTYARSCWLRFRAPNGEEFSYPPTLLTRRVNVLIDPTAERIEPAWPDGAREAWLLAQELGATEIATQDVKTGEVWCPADQGHDDELYHMEIAHGMDVTELRKFREDPTVDFDLSMQAVWAAHEEAHANPVGKGGFPHRHVPEDLTIT